MASENGYFSSFIPARGTAGRPSGGLAILCKQAAPQQRMEEGKQWEAGRWAHYLLPYEKGYMSITCMVMIPLTSKLPN
eukprot:2500394-Amphidinium_carterae.1